MDSAISNLTVADPLVAGRLLMACHIAFGAFEEALIDVRDSVDADAYKQIRSAIAAVVGMDMHDLRNQLITQHPQFDLPTAAKFVARYKEAH